MSTWDQIQQNKNLKVPADWWQIDTIDMHTCGEPLRVILNGYPTIEGQNVLQRRKYLKENLDYLRTSLMFEPRGHADMYGCILVPPNDDKADFGIIFMHNEGYSTMCGHAIIAISKLAVEMKWVSSDNAFTTLKIEAPCGLITSYVNQTTGKVKFHCVPSFVRGLDKIIQHPEHGNIYYDLAYGGAFYAYVDLSKNKLKLGLQKSDYQSLIKLGMEIKNLVNEKDQDIKHPFEAELSFLYGTIFIGEPKDQNNDSRNVCIFAEGEVDRCPTGSGVSGRMAIHHARQELKLGEEMKIESILGTIFLASIYETTEFGSIPAVIPEVEGTANIIGKHSFLIDPSDPLKDGFLLR